ncbi:MAG: hypothetical protein ACLGSH_07620 [Acidobacteriota bacterium]
MSRRIGMLFLPLSLAAVAVLTGSVRSQQAPRDEEFEPLVFDRIIPMPSVQGRIDHMTVDPKTGRIFAAVYGNDTVEVLDVHRAREIAVIRGGLGEPQGVAFLPESNRIAVTSDTGGTVTFFNGTSYSRIGSVSFGDDADQIRYDAPAHRLYVGYGDDAQSAIGIVDTRTWQKLPQTYRLDAHPESFQLDDAGHRIFVNIASKGEIAVVHTDSGKVDTWKLPGAWQNFPMALDEKDQRLIVAARRPARLMVLDMETGKLIASLPGADDTDDMWYDATRHRIYEPSGEGFIFVYQQVTPDLYDRVAKIPTAIGARTSAYFGQVGKHNDLYLAVPPRANRGAEMWVFETRD